VSFLIVVTCRSTSSMVSLRKCHSNREMMLLVVQQTPAFGENSTNQGLFLPLSVVDLLVVRHVVPTEAGALPEGDGVLHRTLSL